MLNRIFNFVSRLLQNDGLMWGAANLSSRSVIAVRSRFASAALRAPRLHLGGRASIRGAKHIQFGRGVHVGGSIWIEAVTSYAGQQYSPAITIGDEASFSHDVHITAIERIDIGRRVLFGSRVYVADHAHGIYKGSAQSDPTTPPTQRPLGGGGPVVIGDDVWIGDNAVIVGPIVVGHGAIIGANAVVRKDVPAGVMVAGIPARIIKRFDRESSSWNLS
jgi:acetyltransferase-like isoleucine patch superfamily enzyme